MKYKKMPYDWHAFKEIAFQKAQTAKRQHIRTEELKTLYKDYQAASDVWENETLCKVYLQYLNGEISKEQGTAEMLTIKKKWESLVASYTETSKFLSAAVSAYEYCELGKSKEFVCPNCGGKAFVQKTAFGKKTGIFAKCEKCQYTIMS